MPAIHAFGNNIMRVHDVPTFKATQFAPLLNSLRKKIPGGLWMDTEPGHQAVHEGEKASRERIINRHADHGLKQVTHERIDEGVKVPWLFWTKECCPLGSDALKRYCS
jgi:hypothetical protein